MSPNEVDGNAFAVMGSERWMKMEELNGYTPPASLNLSDFQDAIGDAVVQAIIKIGIRVNREELLKALKYDRDRKIRNWRYMNNGRTEFQI